MAKYKYKIDVPVLLVFFIRPDTLQQVFNQIRIARPSRLYLCQDGPRTNHPEDIDNINRCRQIVEDIDWECAVFKNYSDNNLGCGFRPFSGITWALNNENYIIILEDDCVPSISFFSFCAQLLEKYYDDQRINMITGYNLDNIYKECTDSYFFAKSGTNWGWATWKRAWEDVEYNIDLVNDKFTQKLLKKQLGVRSFKNTFGFFKVLPKLIQTNKCTVWDAQWGIVKHLYSSLAIVPKKNMIKNIGFGEGNTHAAELKRLPNKIRKLFNKPLYELEEDLRHPKYIMCDTFYDKKFSDIINPSFTEKLIRKFEVYFNLIFNR